MESKSSSLRERFLNPIFANCVHVKRCSFTLLSVNFFSPKCSIFAVECYWNSKISLWKKNERNWGLCFEKIDEFFETAKCGKFFFAYQVVFFPKNVFPTLIVRVLAKNQKIFKIGKFFLENMKQSLKKRFHLWKKPLYQNGKAENKLAIAGLLVVFKI